MLFRCFSKSFAVLALASVALPGSALLANLTLDTPHQVVSNQTSVWFSGRIEVLQDFQFGGFFVKHPYLEGSYATRLEVGDYAQGLYSWFGTVGHNKAGATYTGSLFRIDIPAGSPNGLYNHDFADLNSPSVAYLYTNTSNGQIRSNEAAFSVELVPEPGTLAALGLGGVALMRRRRAQ